MSELDNTTTQPDNPPVTLNALQAATDNAQAAQPPEGIETSVPLPTRDELAAVALLQATGLSRAQAAGQVRRGRGRPRKLGVVEKARILRDLANAHSISDAAGSLGVSLDTIRRERDADPIFADQVLRALKHGKKKLVGFVVRAGAKDWRAAFAMLQSRWGKEFATRQKTEVTGADGGPIETQTEHSFSYDAYARMFSQQAGVTVTRPELENAVNGNNRIGAIADGEGTAPADGS